MLAASVSSTRCFGARTVVAAGAIVLVALLAGERAVHAQQDCKMECYPDAKMINSGKGSGKSDNCRWVLRTDGKAARLCEHIKCRKVCANNQAASAAIDQQGAASDNMRVEQQTESESPNSATGAGESMGIMRHMHGSKIAKAPVAGVAGGRLSQATGSGSSSGSGGFGPAPGASSTGRRSAPTLPPATGYDENDTPPPIARFLDISPEE